MVLRQPRLADGRAVSKRNPRYANGARRRAIRARLLATQDTCALCGRPIDKTLRTPHPMSAEVDEIVPVSRGGDPLDIRNCQLVHRVCNQRKGNGGRRKSPPKASGLPTSREW